MIDFSGGKVLPDYFLPVEVDDGAVIGHEAQVESEERGRIWGLKCVAQIGGDMAIAGAGAVRNHGRLVVVTVTELWRSLGPKAVIIRAASPLRALVGSIVQIAPDRWLRRGHRGRAGGGDERRPARALSRPVVSVALDIKNWQRRFRFQISSRTESSRPTGPNDFHLISQV